MQLIELIFMLGCLAALVVLVAIFANRKPQPGRMIKSESRHKEIPEDLTVPDEFYRLNWKPPLQPTALADEIRAAIGQIEAISPLVSDLSLRINDEHVDPHEISRLISSDPGLTTHVLKRVNSPYYALVQTVDNIFNAIIILGYNEIYRLVLEERLEKTGIRPSKAAWLHANLVATIAAHLARVSRSGLSGGSLVTLGIMHDIGRTVLEQIKGPLPTEASTDPRLRLQAELDFYGIDHASLGAAICRQWRIPEKTCRAIEAHPLPLFYPLRELARNSQDNLRETSLLAVADHVAHCFIEESEPSLIGWDYFQYLKLEPALDSLLEGKIRRELDRFRNFSE